MNDTLDPEIKNIQQKVVLLRELNRLHICPDSSEKLEQLEIWLITHNRPLFGNRAILPTNSRAYTHRPAYPRADLNR